MALLATAPKTIKTGIKPLKTIYYLDGRNIAFLVFEVDKLKIEQQQNVDKNK